jgi:hypothetical protein
VKEQGQGGPDQKPKNKESASPKEQGRLQSEGKERQPLPSVWDVLERRVKLWAPALEQPLMSKEEYVREAWEVKLLKEEKEEKGTDREKLIFALFELDTRAFKPNRPGTDILNLSGTDLRSIFLEELQQFRSRVEPMSDKELTMEVRQLESFWRRLNEGTKE